MYVKCSFVFTLCLYIEFTISTDLQLKEYHLPKGDMSELINAIKLTHPPLGLRRVGRHIEVKPGNVMSHLLNEAGNGRHNIDDGNSNHFIRRALRIIEMKLKRLLKNKNRNTSKKLKSTSTKETGE